MMLRLLFFTFFAAVIIVGCGKVGKVGYGVDELADQAVADEEAFMGKEVVVSGYVAHVMRDVNSKVTGLSLDFDLHSATERQLSCAIADGQISDDILSKWITVKGTITNIHSQNYMGLKGIALDPCESIKDN